MISTRLLQSQEKLSNRSIMQCSQITDARHNLVAMSCRFVAESVHGSLLMYLLIYKPFMGIWNVDDCCK